MDETSAAFPDLDPLVGVDEASLGADDALVTNLEVLMPEDGTPTPVRMPSRGRGGNKQTPVPTRIDIIEPRLPASYPKADNAVKREASRQLDSTMRKTPISNPATVQAIRGRMAPQQQSRPEPMDPGEKDMYESLLVIGGLALLGVSAYFLIKHFTAAPVVAEVVSNVPAAP